jgi:RNAse (barnase) inhibitor barstar
MEVKILEGSQINSEIDFHFYISKLLAFPNGFGLDFEKFWTSFYGKNFAAFWDCFTDCICGDPPFKIVVKDHLHAKKGMGESFSLFMDAFEDAKKRYPKKFDYSLE